MNHDAIKEHTIADICRMGSIRRSFRCPRHGHTLPPSEWIDRAIDKLDEPLALLRQKCLRPVSSFERSSKLPEARRLYQAVGIAWRSEAGKPRAGTPSETSDSNSTHASSFTLADNPASRSGGFPNGRSTATPHACRELRTKQAVYPGKRTSRTNCARLFRHRGCSRSKANASTSAAAMMEVT